MAKYALVVGINYKGHKFINAREFAVSDAMKINNFLITAGFDTVLLSETDATLDEIQRGLVSIQQKLKPGDTFLFYFSGQGLQTEHIQFLLPFDACVPMITKEEAEIFSVNSVENETRGVQGVQRIFIVDACWNLPDCGQSSAGKALEFNTKIISLATENRYFPQFPVAVFCSCDESSTDTRFSPLGGSIFTRALLRVCNETLSSGLEVSLPGICNPIQEEISRLTQEHALESKVQSPYFKEDIAGEKFAIYSEKIITPLSEKKKKAKARADALLEKLLKDHREWLRDRLKGSSKRLYRHKTRRIFEIYKKMKLGGPNLSGCNLVDACFDEIDFPDGTNFSCADLSSASFIHAKLSGADFSRCQLSNCDFGGCEATDGNFSNAVFISGTADCALFNRCNFNRIIVNHTGFMGAGIFDSFLGSAALERSDFNSCSVKNCDLTDASLMSSSLVWTNFSGSILTGARLYGTAHADWQLDGVKCQYVYWDAAGENRFPPEKDFENGEFDRQYRSYKEFSYTFTDGLTPLDLMLATHIVDQINAADMGFTIKIDNASVRGLNPTLNFIMESGDEKKDEARELFKVIYEQKIAILEEKLQGSEKLLAERTCRANLAEEQLTEMTAVVKQTFSGEKFGLNARQLLVEHLFNPIMEEVLGNDGLIAQHVSSKSRSIADLKANDLAQYRYVALFGLGPYADAIAKHELDLMHACLSNFMKDDCLFVTESELMNTPENSYIRSVYRCFDDPPESEAYVAVATIFRGINDKILKNPVYHELKRNGHAAIWDESLNNALEQLRASMFIKPLAEFLLRPLPSAKKSLVCPNGRLIRELRNKKIGTLDLACERKIYRDDHNSYFLNKATLIKVEKGEPVTRAKLDDVAKALKVSANRLIFKDIIPNRERLKELRAAVFCTEEELLEQFGVSSPVFFSMLEEAKVIPADTLRCVHHHYKQLIGSMADPFSELIDHPATEALVKQLQQGTKPVK